MTHKEKAKELVDSFRWIDLSYMNIEPMDVYKECALITVDYILELSGTDNVRYTDSFFEYWRKVKIEIQKL